ncbi:MAG: 50S ribosomal protein L30 [Deltaproteobacteria bacterium]|nr:50S ribosomal protein L30 [Deltaproteobacteria bacterium]
MAADAKKLDITLRRSGIGCTQRQRATLRGLGLTRIGKTSIRFDTVSLRGMLRKVDHLIEVREHGPE